MTSKLILKLSVFAFGLFRLGEGIEIEKELTLSFKEKQLLDKFKAKVLPELRENYMRSDLYLIRWLRAQNLNLDAAERMLLENLAWRREEKIDNILKEDWTEFKTRFFMDESGTDLSGRPVVTADISEWDVRAAVLSGKGSKLVRYMIRGLEAASQRVIQSQAQGKNVTQWQVILNMDKFNLNQHGCLQCIPIYIQFIQAHEKYYPYGADKIISINNPAAFEWVLTLLRPIMSPAMREAFMALGRNRQEWRKIVLSIVDPSQIAPHFGGTKEDF